MRPGIGAGKMTEPIKHTITVFADNFQFHLQDKKYECEYPESWNEEIMNGLFVAGTGIIGIGTVRDLDVEVAIEVHSAPLEEKQKEQLPDLSEWDHAVQCTLDLPSGQLMISGPTGDSDEAVVLELAPGHYGVRIFWGNLEDVDDVGFEGEDLYKIVMWPATELETRILKRWRSLVYFDAALLE